MVRTNMHSIYDLEYHLVVVTRYQHPVIADDLAARLVDITHDLLENNWKCHVSEVNTGEDHVHILFEAPPQTQLSRLVNSYKTISSRLLRKEFAEYLKPYYWKPYFWSRSYFITTVSGRTHDTVSRYIRDQGRS